MRDNGQIPTALLDVRRRLLRAAAWYESARTTFAVLRLLDEERLLATPPGTNERTAFVARPGFEV